MTASENKRHNLSRPAYKPPTPEQQQRESESAWRPTQFWKKHIIASIVFRQREEAKKEVAAQAIYEQTQGLYYRPLLPPDSQQCGRGGNNNPAIRPLSDTQPQQYQEHTGAKGSSDNFAYQPSEFDTPATDEFNSYTPSGTQSCNYTRRAFYSPLTGQLGPPDMPSGGGTYYNGMDTTGLASGSRNQGRK